MSKEPSKYHPRDVEDDRSAAFGWAAAFRTRRAELRRELSSGERTLAEVLDGSDATADGAVKLLFVLESLPAAGYARSWEIDVERESGGTEGFPATLRHVAEAGAVVRLELVPDDGPPLKVEISRERFEALGPEPGERLRVLPRKVRVFLSGADGG